MPRNHNLPDTYLCTMQRAIGPDHDTRHHEGRDDCGDGPNSLPEALYYWSQEEKLSAIIEAVRGLTDGIHRDPAVHGDPKLRNLCDSIYSSLTDARDYAAALERLAEES